MELKFCLKSFFLLLFNRQVVNGEIKKLSHDIKTTKKTQIKNLEFNALINKSPAHRANSQLHHRVLIDFSRSKNL